MRSGSPILSGLVDLAERQRREGRRAEALETVKRCLGQKPDHPRAILLLARLLVQDGRPLEALAALRPLDQLQKRDEGWRAVAAGLERLCRESHAPIDPAFATESMALLLIEQGYLLEALAIYRRLVAAGGAEQRLWEAVVSLKDKLGREGSRGAGRETVERELEELERWMRTEQRGG